MKKKKIKFNGLSQLIYYCGKILSLKKIILNWFFNNHDNLNHVDALDIQLFWISFYYAFSFSISFISIAFQQKERSFFSLMITIQNYEIDGRYRLVLDIIFDLFFIEFINTHSKSSNSILLDERKMKKR